MEEYVDIVDEEDNVIGRCEKEESHEKSVIHRIVQAVVMNSKNEIFLVKRARARKNGPGLFDVSIGGHVSSGESYEEAMKREGREELGIKGNYKFLFKYLGTHPRVRHMSSVFLLKHEGPFKIDPLESDEGFWISYKEIIKIPRKKMTAECFNTFTRLKDFINF